MPKGISRAQIDDIALPFSKIKLYFVGLNNQYGSALFIKQLPNAMWGDIWRQNKQTGEWVQTHDMSQLFTVKFSRFVPLDSIIATLEQMDEVEYAHEPIEAISLVDPNDQFFQDGTQWNLPKIDAAKAWDITQGSSSVVVGIIEAGGGSVQDGLPDKSHKDFYTGSGTTGESKFVTGKGDTGPFGPHATGVAGVVGAATNDGDGIASLGWNIKMIPYFISGGSDSSGLVAKIQRAINDGCHVINCSFVTRIQSHSSGECTIYKTRNFPSVANQLAIAIAQGIVVVAGTGNQGFELTEGEIQDCAPYVSELIPYTPYPAANANVIGVSATNSADIWANNLLYNFGEFVGVAAPGFSIKTTDYSQSYQTENGTSFSAPHVSALSGLIKSLNSQLSPSTIESIVRNTAVDVNYGTYPGVDDYLGYGRINAYQALLLTHAYSNKSVSSTATAQNNGRRLVKTSDGKYHLVFESGITSGGNVLSEIFYRNYNGTNWSTPIRLCAGNEQNCFI